jgi:hypothetical protein
MRTPGNTRTFHGHILHTLVHRTERHRTTDTKLTQALAGARQQMPMLCKMTMPTAHL